ncbi:MAG: hypothetical protein RL728_45 [Bacteroidota bacterium]|jgi:hypothetical protein
MYFFPPLRPIGHLASRQGVALPKINFVFNFTNFYCKYLTAFYYKSAWLKVNYLALQIHSIQNIINGKKI